MSNMAQQMPVLPAGMCCWSRGPTYCSLLIWDSGIAGLRWRPPIKLHWTRKPAQTVVRVATKYPHIALEHFNAQGIAVEIIPLSGSIELAPLVSLADRIVDLVESGRTLADNGLRIVEVIAESSARLVVNRASYQTKRQEILQMVETLEALV